jgi:hypothetical protein
LYKCTGNLGIVLVVSREKAAEPCRKLARLSHIEGFGQVIPPLFDFVQERAEEARRISRRGHGAVSWA